MTPNETLYPLSALRALALHAQGLALPLGAEPAPNLENLFRSVEQAGCVQIDTLQMVRRSHYLVLWSRLGAYDPSDLDRLAYEAQHRRLFEGWMRAACLLPLEEYRYQIPHQRYLREVPAKISGIWLSEPGSWELVREMQERIRKEGPVRAAEFEDPRLERSTWWDWKPAKNALEHLYAWGDLMIADRVNFQRVYDLTERVLPAWVDTEEPTPAERDAHWIELSARALGICKPAQLADYTYRKQAVARPIVEELLARGVLVTVKGILQDGRAHDLILHREAVPLLEQAAEGALPAGRTTFLSPFDSLFWARGRDEQLWGFRNVLEAYKPEPSRRWGYFCLPILHQDRLVGRLDPKLERQNGMLRIKALYLEEGVPTDETLISGIAHAMRDFLAFHDARDLVIERSQPEEFGQKLLSAL